MVRQWQESKLGVQSRSFVRAASVGTGCSVGRFLSWPDR